MVKLRRDIVKCFSEETPWGQPPLTYSHLYWEEKRQTNYDPEEINAPTNDSGVVAGGVPPPMPSTTGKMIRRNTIESKSPGLGDQDGFIHTSLARLPLDCFSMKDVELEEIHRLCREATATYAGHRMVISKFRFVETGGEGGESNPCVNPIFDETIDAPPRVRVGVTGGIEQDTTNLYHPHHQRNPFTGGGVSVGQVKNDQNPTTVSQRHATIGALPPIDSKTALNSLFDLAGPGPDRSDTHQ